MRWEKWIYTVPLRVRSLFRRREVERELDEELRNHLEEQIRANMARGMNAEYGIVLTYPVSVIDTRRKVFADLKHKTWNHALQSLETFFTERAQAGFKFTLREGAPVKLNLGDEVPPW